uniref:CRAL-TRIO domain-containing protein n=1 Tax=Peronospora matthiolae TaxID=2874970 RepID=A0AAV1VCZ9_9STRA
MPSAPASTTSSDASISPRPSHPSSISSALSTPVSLSLPGLLPGTHLGILASGPLDKRRDGAVRGGWAKRLFLLSTRSLHYYRKTEEMELFGKERGHVLLSDIAFAKVVLPTDAPAGAVEPGRVSFYIAVLSKRKTLLLFLRADTLDYASSWVSLINIAVQTAKSVGFAPRWTVETMQTFLSATSGNDEELEEVVTESPTKVVMTTTPVTRPVPSVLVVSMISGQSSVSDSMERLVKRNIELHTELQLGVFEQKDTCVIVLSDGEEIRISRQMLGNDTESLLTSTKPLDLTTPARSQPMRPHVMSMSRVSVSFRCVPAPPAPITRRDSGIQPVTSSLPSTFTIAFPGTLGGLFLISCLVSSYCAAPFVGLMKITIVLGFILSISQIAQFVICLSDTKSHKRLSSVLLPICGSRKAAATVENELIYHITISKIEVVEVDRFAELALPDAVLPAANASDSSETAVTSISGGPIAFSPRFIAGEKGDVAKGRARYLATLEWRENNGIDDILVTPHPNFEIIKKYYPQYFHGRSREGLPVYYERPGKIDLAALKREGLSMDDLLRHYTYMTEYLWRVLEPDDAARSITVLDVTGIGMYDLGGEVLDFIKRASAFTGAHYPERSAHILIINIPGWFNMVWRMVKPLIDPVTREKVHMLKGGCAIRRELEKLIDVTNIPSDFGGEGAALGDSKEEHALAAHVKEYL